MKEIEELLEITEKLRNLKIAQERKFTLDGNLVGDIGEVLAAEKYGIKLHPPGNNIHDGIEIKSGKEVQIKSSFGCQSYFPTNKDHIPDYLLAIKIKNNGKIVELYNGPGSLIQKEYIEKRQLKYAPRKYLFRLSGNILQKINKDVSESDKIKDLTDE